MIDSRVVITFALHEANLGLILRVPYGSPSTLPQIIPECSPGISSEMSEVQKKYKITTIITTNQVGHS